MSRWDSDRDYYDEPWHRPNATCSDCWADFIKDPADVGTLCDACCSRRDEHTTAVEIRMAKATLKARTPIQTGVNPAIVDVAIVPVSIDAGVVNVALVPQPAAGLTRIASAILAADLTTIRDVA